MSVSKRVRFEVLRRDQHACQYCGSIAPDVDLTIDHVVPVALGGSDDPGNLVAACKDCNAGKTSIQPDSPLVKQVSDHAAAYALGLLDRMTRLRGDLEREEQWAEEFEAIWNEWKYSSGPRKEQCIPLPAGWEKSVVRWYAMGVPEVLVRKAIRTAMTKDDLRGEDATFAYMAGVIWRTIDGLEIDYDIPTDHAAVATARDVHDARCAAHDIGLRAGFDRGLEIAHETHEASRHPGERALIAHIDGSAVSHVA